MSKKQKIQARVLLIPDAHVPFHDKKAWALAMRVAEAFDPSNVVILGDFVDFYAVSSHLKDPGKTYDGMTEEIHIGKCLLRELKCHTSNAMSYVYCGGNHEYRLDRYIASNAPELYGIVTTEKLLNLKELGYDFVPYKKSFSIGKLNVTHDIGGAGRTAHLKAAQLYGDNIVIGHVHSAGISYTGTPGGDPHVGMSCGWLGSVEEVDYMHNDVVKSTWMHGVGIAFILDDGTAHCHFIPFVKNTAVVPTETGAVVLREGE